MSFDARSPRSPRRRGLSRWLRTAAALSLLAASGAAAAQAYPSKPLKFVVPFPAGGDLEPVARGLAEHFQKIWGQSAHVDFKPGAQAMIGTEFVARSEPDGHTLLICSVGAMTINPSLYPKTPYTVGKDIVPVSMVARTPMVLVAGPKLGARTYAELLAKVRAEPGRVSYASAGIGNVTHLTGELFTRQAGVRMVHVPYKGAQSIIADLLGGHIEMYFNPLPSARGYLSSNAEKVTPLAVTTIERTPLLPDVPTLDELGLKGFDVSSWYGLCAPGGTPRSVIDKLAAGVADAIRNGGLAERLKGFGMTTVGDTPEQFSEQIRKEGATWATMIRELGIKPE
ncbi:MAG TPA: tripartite tricarboxylate transporter substrate binding protein [Burkholderiaceae bacterium]|nr:tripartite tricarboxylate transporter substrate binding protein [Burkholderiaceae bacterium]